MESNPLSVIVETLIELKEDGSVPKNVKLKINEIIDLLNSNIDKSIKIDKVQHIFDELNDDSNIDSFTRTQLWNLVSMLERV
jgi:uncharacterized protein (UPF0147 family)